MHYDVLFCRDAFATDPDLSNLLLDDFFRDAVHDCQAAWRDVIAASVEVGIPTPAFSTALAFYDGYRSAKLPANLIQVSNDVSKLMARSSAREDSLSSCIQNRALRFQRRVSTLQINNTLESPRLTYSHMAIQASLLLLVVNLLT
jgi:hypothetical protein